LAVVAVLRTKPVEAVVALKAAAKAAVVAVQAGQLALHSKPLRRRPHPIVWPVLDLPTGARRKEIKNPVQSKTWRRSLRRQQNLRPPAGVVPPLDAVPAEPELPATETRLVNDRTPVGGCTRR
jgi:hypothetical protein